MKRILSINLFSALVIGAVLFYTFLFYFPHFWKVLIDWDIDCPTRSASENATYWNWWYIQTYFRQWLPWGLLAYFIPHPRRLLKTCALYLSALHLFALLDLLLTGNQVSGLWEPLGFMFALLYTSGIYALFWANNPMSDLVEPSGTYIISRAPKSLLEWIGSLVFRSWAGSYFVYSDGYCYGYSRKGIWPRYEVRECANFTLQKGQVAKRVNVQSWAVKANGAKLENCPWKFDCRGKVKKILS